MAEEHGKFMGVSTSDPDIVNAIHRMRDKGQSKEEALRVVGMPMEVIDKHWGTGKDKKSKERRRTGE